MACATLTSVRTIGVLGGMTWHSSIEYYRMINTLANERLGGIHTPRCIVFSVDMGTIVAGLSIPTIHIGDATAAALDGFEQVALLGTQFTMELPFLRERIEQRGIDVVVPDEADRQRIGRTVFEEFSRGIFSDETRVYYVDVIRRLDAQAVVLGCTEIGLLLGADDVDLPLIDTADAHVRAVVDYAT